ncbi:hypothetical protein LXL04_009673 [Taraxacum kok-saghyz]
MSCTSLVLPSPTLLSSPPDRDRDCTGYVCILLFSQANDIHLVSTTRRLSTKVNINTIELHDTFVCWPPLCVNLCRVSVNFPHPCAKRFPNSLSESCQVLVITAFVGFRYFKPCLCQCLHFFVFPNKSAL